GELAKMGADVTVFEALHKVGGVLVYGIPEFRLPKDLVAREVSSLSDLGVSFETNAVIGRLYDVDELLDEQGFDAVFVGTGAGLPGYLGIEGEGLNGVMVANELLTRVNLMKAYLFPEHETPVYVGKKCIVFQMLTSPVRALGDDKGWIAGLECERMELGEPDASGRRRPKPVAGSEFVMDA